MRLVHLEIQGFKSFADRTQLEFAEGSTAIVGPNGCGKSNISDAMAWVLGEQSPKSLRGARMEDVLFNGTARRKPVGLSQVTLTLRTEAGDLVRIGRRLDREGVSEYILDGKAVRRKDVVDFLAGSGLTVRAYSHIEQGKIDQVLSAKPEDRRLLLEEAAGISRYRLHRKQAAQKLEGTEANLLRLQDVVREVDEQHASLARQAAKARRVVADREALGILQKALYYQRAIDLNARSEELTRERDMHRAAMAEAVARESDAQATWVQIQDRMDAQRRDVDQLEAELHDTDLRIKQIEKEQALSAERLLSARSQRQSTEAEMAPIPERLTALEQQQAASAARLEELRAADPAGAVKDGESRTAALEAALSEAHGAVRAGQDAILKAAREASEHRNALAAAEAAAGAAVRERDENETAGGVLRAELDKLEGARALAEGTLTQAATQASAAEAERQRASESLASCTARLQEERKQEEAARDAWRSAVHRRDSWSEALRRQEEHSETHAALDSAGVTGKLFGGLVQVKDPAHLPAVESALETQLKSHVIADASVGAVAAGRHGKTFLLVDGRVRHGARPERPADVLWLSDLLQGDEKALAFVPAWLFADVDKVPACWGQVDVPVVNRAGDQFFPDGRCVLSSSEETGGVLRARRELEDLTSAAASAEEAAQVARASLERAEAAEANAREALEAARSQAEVARAAERDARGALDLVTAQIEPLRTRQADVARVIQEAGERVAGLQARIGMAQEGIRAAATAQEEAERRAPQLDEARLAAEQALSGARENLGRLREEAARFRDRLAEAEASHRDLELRIRDLTAHRDRLHTRLGDLEGIITRETESHDQRARELAQVLHARDACRERRVTAEEQLRAMVEEERHLSADVKRLRDNAEQLKELSHQSDIAWGALRERAAAMEERCVEDMGVGLQEMMAGDDPRPEGFDTEEAARETERLKKRLDSAGPVNFVAAEEAEALNERLTFLRAQMADVESAAEELRGTIRKMDASSRTLFVEAFEAVAAHFSTIFTTVFGGGEAHLRLEDPADPLNSGIEIFAMPPGKRLQSISLLSGGERAMTAVALLFALFRHHPSPFCVLDEVDAPLDETNTGRYIQMLRSFKEHTQFIVITHNRQTMEASDFLYGVTMEEPGVSTVLSLKLEDLPVEEQPALAGETD